MDRPIIVVGLGNPGTRYRDTRHNLGFRVVDRLAERWDVRFDPQPIDEVARVATPRGGHDGIVLAKPITFMNHSGYATSALSRRLSVPASSILVVYDDLDLELGRIRIRPGGSAGSHNGMRSIVDLMGSHRIPRIRAGVRGGPIDRRDLAAYVLAPFEPDEIDVVDRLIDLSADAVEGVLELGLTPAMNRYNARLAIGAGDPPADED